MTETTPQIPAQHRAVVIEETGGPEALTWTTVDTPRPGIGEVLIRTAATGLNFIETYQRSGVYPLSLPFTPGTEGAGEVVALGEGVSSVAVGDRVATAAGRATYAEHFVAPADQLLGVPETMDLAEAAALPLQGMTAHYLCRSTYPVAAGDTVLLHAGAGGVGLVLTQLCVSLGAAVYTTASTEEKKELSRAAGATEVFDYDDVAARVRERTDGVGVNVVFDGVGKDTFEQSLSALRPRGTMVLFGGSSGQVPPFDLQRLNALGSLYVTRPSLVAYTATGEETAWRGEELFAALNEGTLDLRIGARVPLAEAARAHAALEGRETTGKVILTV
ncbi:MAG: quinone oxidoreductase family protein [Micrococcaceae bacterium]